MQFRKKAIAVLMASVMLAAGLTGCGKTDNNSSTGNSSSTTTDNTAADKGTESSGEIFNLEMAILTFGATPKDMAEVVSEINKISEAEVGVHVNITPISIGDFQTQINLILSGNEKLDLLPVMSSNFSSYVAKGQLLAIDKELEEYGQGIIEAIGTDYLAAGKVGGEQYGITTNRDLAKDFGIMMRADLAEKYGVDYDSINSLADFESVLKAVKEGESDIIPLIPPTEKGRWFDFFGGYDGLGDNLGVLPNYGEELTVENLFASAEYKEFITLMRDWYQKGYILEDSSTASEIGPALVKAGRGFAYICGGKPGYVAQEKGMTGYDMKYITFRPAATSTSIVQTIQWAIPRNCENTEKTMQFLNLMYTNADIQNLLSWGVEGKHYVISEDGHATYPEGVDATNTGFGLSMGWQFGNQFLTHVWEGDDLDLWQQMDTFNKSAKVSNAMGFSWDSSNVKTEVAACTNILDQYRISLECGMVDPEVILPEFLKALEDAGINKIIAEKQAQIDAWAAAK